MCCAGLGRSTGAGGSVDRAGGPEVLRLVLRGMARVAASQRIGEGCWSRGGQPEVLRRDGQREQSRAWPGKAQSGVERVVRACRDCEKAP